MQLPSLFTSPVRPLTETESAILLGAWMLERRTPEPDPPLDADPECPHGFKILQARLVAAGVPYSPWLVFFLAAISDTPGKCVMWAHSVATKTRELGRAITVADFGETLSPEGVPTEEAYLTFWFAQKCLLGNYLDTAEAWSNDHEPEHSDRSLLLRDRGA